MELKSVPIIGIVITPDFPVEHIGIVRAYLDQVTSQYGNEVSFITSIPDKFIDCFRLMNHVQGGRATADDRSGRVINNDFIAANSNESVIFFAEDSDIEVSVFQMKMRHLHRRLTKIEISIRDNIYDVDDIPF